MRPQNFETISQRIGDRRFAIVVDPILVELYAQDIQSLRAHENCIGMCTCVASESHKTLQELNGLLETLLSFEIHRDEVIVAIGGGIVTDMAGLAAHLIKRGINWIAVPTTLLGMIDAAIGGKTAVDMPQGKNLIGAFHPPEEVIVIPSFLETLPEREWVNGIGEAVKYGFLTNIEFLEKLYCTTDQKKLVLQYVEVFKAYKESIVEQDPDEKHVRMHLNLGHTLGHCLEKHFDYQRFAHGEAVMYGLYWSLVLSNMYCNLSDDHLNAYFHWLSSQPWYNAEVLSHPEWFITGLSQDKKIRRGMLNFVLLDDVGQPVVKTLSIEALRSMLLEPSKQLYDSKWIDHMLFIPRPLNGTLSAPPSKSDSHRAIIAGSLAALTGNQLSTASIVGENKETELTVGHVRGLVYSQDVCATLSAMASFGLKINESGDTVTFFKSSLITPSKPIDCNESGSTLRFCIPISQLVDGPVTFTGQNHLRYRPLTDYIDLFNKNAVPYTYNGALPIEVFKGALNGKLTMKGNVSSQYFSGLFFTLPLMPKDTEIEVIGNLESKGYVDMTLETLKRHGIQIHNDSYKRFVIPGNQLYNHCDYIVEGDYSNAAFWIVAGQICGPIRLNGLRKSSLQRDKEVIDVVKAMGGHIYWEGDTLVSMPSKTHGTLIDAREIPDIIPILSVLAALSEGKTEVINGERLRVKESDRIKSTVSELKKLGADIQETENGMIIQGRSTLYGGMVNSWNDHRIAMAMTIASTRCDGPVILHGSMAVRKSYPHFYSDYRALGGRVVKLEMP